MLPLFINLHSKCTRFSLMLELKQLFILCRDYVVELILRDVDIVHVVVTAEEKTRQNQPGIYHQPLSIRCLAKIER